MSLAATSASSIAVVSANLLSNCAACLVGFFLISPLVAGPQLRMRVQSWGDVMASMLGARSEVQQVHCVIFHRGSSLNTRTAAIALCCSYLPR